MAELALASAGDIEQLVRASGTLFLVTDRNGDIAPPGTRELGLFHRDTRYLSHYALRIEDGIIVRLSAETSGDGYNQVDLMLSGLESLAFLDDPQNYLHIRRRQALDGGFAEHIAFTSFLRRRVSLVVTIAFAADYADVFEVRGARRERRGTMREPRISGRTVLFAYRGVDGREYTTHVSFSAQPTDLTGSVAVFDFDIGPGENAVLEVNVTPGLGEPVTAPFAFRQRVARLTEEAERFRDRTTHISCDNGRVQKLLDRSVRDLVALRMSTQSGTILAAGIPWFCAPFGRDALIASYEALLMNPELAAESLRFLAAHQGRRDDDRTEEEPGKIFHELRFGEMAMAGEIPHSPYYGSIDATPLFVIVLDAFQQFTADRALLGELAAALRAALAWIDVRSEDGSRLVTYKRRSPRGLENQGWKDSRAGVSFPDGRRAEPPIALVEVQGYCVDAYARGARLLEALGDEEAASVYRGRAANMRALVERSMWIDDARRYAFAIDGQGRPLNTVVSNVGHLLWSRIPSDERASATARLLLSPASFSGFGIRTLAEGQPVYNPLSYHNGTVWPHDNALIARGMCNFGLTDEALEIFDGLYNSAEFLPDGRVPELYCGMRRRQGPLVRYPVACSPQAWAAAAPFLMLQSVLGIHADAPRQRLSIKSPKLPSYLRLIDIRNMRIGNSIVALRFRRVGARCHVDRLDVAGAPLRTQIEID